MPASPPSWAMVGNEGEITLFHCKMWHSEVGHLPTTVSMNIYFMEALYVKSAAVFTVYVYTMAIFILDANNPIPCAC